MLFGAIVREDRSLIDLIDADYTFVDERLARHYGIPNVQRQLLPARRRCDADSPRRGLLGQGSMLTVTSAATRTSPVSRGKWMLENLLGDAAAGAAAGRRDRISAARKAAKTSDAAAAPGSASREPDVRVVSQDHGPDGLRAGELRSGRRLARARRPEPRSTRRASWPTARRSSGPADLRQAVLSRSDAFMTTVTEKLMTYALGRPVHDYDMPTVRAIVRRAAANDNRFSSLRAGNHRKRLVSEENQEVGRQSRGS